MLLLTWVCRLASFGVYPGVKWYNGISHSSASSCLGSPHTDFHSHQQCIRVLAYLTHTRSCFFVFLDKPFWKGADEILVKSFFSLIAKDFEHFFHVFIDHVLFWEVIVQLFLLIIHLKRFIILCHICVCTCINLWVSHTCRSTKRQEEHIRYPRAGITGSCELPDVGARDGTKVFCKSSKHSNLYWLILNIIQWFGEGQSLGHYRVCGLLTIFSSPAMRSVVEKSAPQLW